MPLFALVLAATISADPPPAREVLSGAPAVQTADEHPIPFYLPRGVSLGLFINPPVVTPHLRLQWEGAIYERPRNHLTLFLAVGTGISTGMPTGIRAIYQHVAFAGIGYKSTHQVFHWGFQLGAGAIWYRASYLPGEPYLFDNRVEGYSEFRVEMGGRLAKNVILGGFVGYGAPWYINPAYPANVYLGGPMFGVFVDWR